MNERKEMTTLEDYRAREAARQARYAALSPEDREHNDASHRYTLIDDTRRCMYCEIGQWNGWKENCNV